MVTWQITENFHSRTLGTFRDLISGKKEKPLFSINEQRGEVVSICPVFSHITDGINPPPSAPPSACPSPSKPSSVLLSLPGPWRGRGGPTRHFPQLWALLTDIISCRAPQLFDFVTRDWKYFPHPHPTEKLLFIQIVGSLMSGGNSTSFSCHWGDLPLSWEETATFKVCNVPREERISPPT